MRLIEKNNPQKFSLHEIKATIALYTTDPAYSVQATAMGTCEVGLCSIINIH